MRVVRQTGEAPALDLVDDPLAGLLIPRPRGDVLAVDRVEFVGVRAARVVRHPTECTVPFQERPPIPRHGTLRARRLPTMRFRVAFASMSIVAGACSSGDGRDLVTDETVATTAAAPATNTTVATVPITPSESQVSATVTMTATSDLDPDATGPEGFDTVAATITSAAGEVCEVCLWLASTPEQRSRGLMQVTDLGDGDGMIFRYEIATSTSFWMKSTPMPLSIAFFDGNGMFIEAFDMEPCADDPCPRYPTPPEFVDAIEFPQGTLVEFGVGAGSVLEVTELRCA